MRKPQKGRLGYWLRQLSPDTGEGSITGVLATITTFGGGTCLSPKVADGINYQGSNDSTYPCNSLNDILALKDQCEQAGFAFLPVIVPRGVDVQGEAQMHGEICAAIGSGMFDIEPYSGFYTNLQTIPAYTQELRNAAGNAYLMLQPDPRQYGLSGISFPSIVDNFDALCCQHYVGWTEYGWMDVAAEVRSFNSLLQYGKDMYATLWGAGDLPTVTAFWNQIKNAVQGVNIFAFGPMDAAHLQAMAALDLNSLPAPDPFVDPTPDRYLTALQSVSATLHEVLSEIDGVIAGE